MRYSPSRRPVPSLVFMDDLERIPVRVEYISGIEQLDCRPGWRWEHRDSSATGWM